jgi:hypothetical protein
MVERTREQDKAHYYAMQAVNVNGMDPFKALASINDPSLICRGILCRPNHKGEVIEVGRVFEFNGTFKTHYGSEHL